MPKDPTGRALQLLSLLQTHRLWRGAELAERLEVTERTARQRNSIRISQPHRPPTTGNMHGWIRHAYVPLWAGVIVVVAAERRYAPWIDTSWVGSPGLSEVEKVPMADFLKALVIFAVAFALFTLPATWLLMLFFGNIGMELSYVATLPLGILASVLLGGVTSRTY